MSEPTYKSCGHEDWRQLMVVETGGEKACAYEATEFPGVIRWWADDQCLPAELCERMGWPTLVAQRQAIQDQAEAYATILAIYEGC